MLSNVDQSSLRRHFFDKKEKEMNRETLLENFNLTALTLVTGQYQSLSGPVARTGSKQAGGGKGKGKGITEAAVVVTLKGKELDGCFGLLSSHDDAVVAV